MESFIKSYNKRGNSRRWWWCKNMSENKHHENSDEEWRLKIFS